MHLYADCWIGEFGWELFCWQGHLRWLARRSDGATVACKAGHEILYRDFAETVPVKVKCNDSNMWLCDGIKPPEISKLVAVKGKHKLIRPPAVRYDHTHKHDKQKYFSSFKNQEFVRLGNPGAHVGYDILIHARSKSNKVNNGQNSNYRNWSERNWKQFADAYKGLRIACIGTQADALHITGADLRGESLETLCDVMANSRVLIGPSSGPIHLAALCGCPQITWWGDPYGKENKVRFTKDWNPFGVPCYGEYVAKWDPPVQWVIDMMDRNIVI